MSKKEELSKYSNHAKVLKKAIYLFGNDVKLRISTRKNKKYMIENSDGKWIHFGQMGYEDYTLHKDKERRKAFKNRNKAWQNAPIYSPRFLSYFILW